MGAEGSWGLAHSFNGSVLYFQQCLSNERAEPAMTRILVIARMPALIHGESNVIQWERVANEVRHPPVDRSTMPGDRCNEIGPLHDGGDLEPVCHRHNCVSGKTSLRQAFVNHRSSDRRARDLQVL